MAKIAELSVHGRALVPAIALPGACRAAHVLLGAMHHIKSAVTIAALGILLLCFRHWPGDTKDAGPLQALTRLPLLSLKRVVGERSSASCLAEVWHSTARALLPCTGCADADYTSLRATDTGGPRYCDLRGVPALPHLAPAPAAQRSGCASLCIECCACRMCYHSRAGGCLSDTARGLAGSAEVSAEERNNARLAALQRAQAELDSLVAGRVCLAQALHSGLGSCRSPDLSMPAAALRLRSRAVLLGV